MANINQDRPIYITYARNKPDHPGWEHISDIEPIIVDALRRNNFEVYDDVADLLPGGKITSFEQQIGDSEFTIIIFSDKYFRSPHCMYEFAEIKKAVDQKKKKMLVCIKSGTFDLADPNYIKDLRDHWKNYANTMTNIEFDMIRELTPIERAAKDNGFYKNYIGNLSSFFADQNYLNANNLNLDDLINTFKAEFVSKQYYLALNDNQHEGPLGLSEIKRKLRSMSKDTLVWKPGIPWTKAIDVPELSSAFPIVPPPIPKFASSAKVIESVENHIITPDPHPAVDLGLSVLWADRNIGADNPCDYGDYFAWGETKPKPQFAWDNYKYANGNFDKLTKYCNKREYGNNGITDFKQILLPEDDAASASWHGEWRMPTIDEFIELKNNCHWDREDNYKGEGKKGYIVSGNGNQIFLPAAGWRSDTLRGAGSDGDFWSSSLNLGYPDNARILCFDAGSVFMGNYGRRDVGMSVRAVRRKN